MRIIIGKWNGSFEIVLIIVILLIVIISHIGCSCSRFKKNDIYSMFSDVKEGFGNISSFESVKSPPPNPKKWEQPTLAICPDQPLTQAVTDIVRRKYGKPIPGTNEVMFETTKFKPECCPNTYSTSTGCACMTLGQYKWLNERGGNNSPPQPDF